MILLKKNSTGSYRVYNDENNIEWCKSYSVWVARKGNGEVVIDEKYYKYSVTTSRHIGMFLNESSVTIGKLVKDGTIKLVNLN
jgi:hypothetical protein